MMCLRKTGGSVFLIVFVVSLINLRVVAFRIGELLHDLGYIDFVVIKRFEHILG